MTTALGTHVRRAWNALTTTTRQRRALRLAVARLDVCAADWPDRVDVDTLNMSSHHDCVLGQVFGDYDRGLYALYGGSYWPFETNVSARAFAAGFPRRLWFAELRDRRRAATDRERAVIS